MQIRDLKLADYMVAVKSVNSALADENRYARLLSEASTDTPIIDGLLRELALLEAAPDSEKKKVGLAAAQRDLVVLLALRSLKE